MFILRFLYIFSLFAFVASASAQTPAPINGDDDIGNAKVGSLAAATMESAGISLQSDFLDFIDGSSEYGDSGPLLVGLLYLISIVTAIFTLAAGGSYKWARYLLIGPPLFFFLTQVRIASDGTDWVFGTREFPQDVKERMLQGVNNFDEGQRGGADVAYFFQFWNVFISDVTQTLVGQLNRDLNDRDMNFVTKVENYMALWDTSEVADNDLRIFIHTIMAPNCSEYFSLRRKVADINILESERLRHVARLSQIQNTYVESFTRTDNITSRLKELGVVTGDIMTCQQMWAGAVTILREKVDDMIRIRLQKRLKPGEEPDQRLALFLQKVGVQTNSLTGEIRYDGGEVSENFVKATDWIVGRTLFQEIWTNNPFAQTFEFEGRENVTAGINAGNISSTDRADSSDSIQQFNYADSFRHRGEYITAAMSMPHFQGIALFILSACYPFFAILVVVPGRAHSIFNWMGLWAWVKLWDLGFAVVMMLDDILYTMLPRGPNLENNEIMDPGLAWERIMTIDPNYSSATYYNIIATCLFAVPVMTGVFVKRGGGELMNLVQGSWQSQADGIAASGATFVRAGQGRRYANVFQNELARRVPIYAQQGRTNSNEVKALNKEMDKLYMVYAGVSAADRIRLASELKGKAVGDMTDKIAKHTLALEINLKDRQKTLAIRTFVKKRLYEWSNSEQGFLLSEKAVGAKYSNHHFSGAGHYMDDMINLSFARGNASDLGMAKKGEDWNVVKKRYDDIQAQLQSGNLSGEDRTKLKAEAQGLELTAATNTRNDFSAQLFDRVGFFSDTGNTITDTLIKPASNAITKGGGSN